MHRVYCARRALLLHFEQGSATQYADARKSHLPACYSRVGKREWERGRKKLPIKTDLIPHYIPNNIESAAKIDAKKPCENARNTRKASISAKRVGNFFARRQLLQVAVGKRVHACTAAAA
jgi:hypothetical protein